jgi:hypothetical protein
MKTLNAVLFIMAIIVLNSCNNQELKEKFALEEEMEIKLEAEKIINEFGYTNYKIFTYFHKEMSQRVISKAVTSNKAVGSGLLPLFNQLTDSSSYTSTITNDFDGYFEQRALTVNYDEDRQNEIIYDYLSIIIIFDEIAIEQKNELLKLLNIYIVNANRGDIIYIISRDEMINKK